MPPTATEPKSPQKAPCSLWRCSFPAFIAGLMLAGIAALIAAAMIEATNTHNFCASCHEMQTFESTWHTAPHGADANGAIAASCTDCHLPPMNDGLVRYLFIKGKSGARDYLYHSLGWQPDWIENLERHNEYTYESGCRHCHTELLAPDIPLKAFLAHREYQLGETSTSCITCHRLQGHGDIKAIMQSDRSEAGNLGETAPEDPMGG